MRNIAKFVVPFLCIPAAAVLIANPPVAVAEDFHSVAFCGGDGSPANAVRTAAQAGVNRAACTPNISLPYTLTFPRR